MGKNVRNIQWSISKEGEWYYGELAPQIDFESSNFIKSHLKDKCLLFINPYESIYFAKQFSKLNIKQSFYNEKDNSKLKYVIISSQEIDFLKDKGSIYEFCFIEIPLSYSIDKIKKIPDIDFTEIKGFNDFEQIIPALEQLDSTLLLNKVDGPYNTFFCTDKKLFETYLIELFNSLLKNLDENFKRFFTPEIILKIMYYAPEYNDLFDNFTIDSSGSLHFKLWNCKLYNENIKVCNISIDGDIVTFSEWENKNPQDVPNYSEDNGGRCLIFFIVIVAIILGIIAGLFYLIKFLIGLF